MFLYIPENNVEDQESSYTSTAEDKSIRKPRYVRVNTLKMSFSNAITYLEDEGWTKQEKIENYEDLTEYDYMLDDFVPNLLVFRHGTEFHKHPLYLDGTFILQDKVSHFRLFTFIR